MELECVMRLMWLGGLAEDRVDGLLRMMRRASATESGYMGGLFQVSAVALGRSWAADQRKPRDNTGHQWSTNQQVITRYTASLQLGN